MDLNTIDTTIAIVLGGSAILGAVGWWIKKKLIDPFRNWLGRLNKVMFYLLPNGGGSVVDALVRIEGRVDENYARAKAILNLQPHAIYECGPDGRCTNANVALCSMFHMDVQDILGNGWAGGVHGDDRERAVDVWLSCVKKEIPYEESYRLKESGKLVHTKATPMFDSRGKVIGYYGVVTHGTNSHKH